MGNATGKGSGAQLSNVHATELASSTYFSPSEVQAIYYHFSLLAIEESGELIISRTEFQEALGMKSSTFVDRLFVVFDENGDGRINFREFLSILSILSTKATEADKLETSFKIYDFDGDGKIGRDELTEMLRATAVEHSLVLDDAELDSVIDATFAEIPGASTHISFAQFSSFVEAHPMMLSQLTLHVSSLIAEGSRG
mmetsp:Transcript_5097/g.11935  ORF Transcript_5097/g.11935 Transcript_5097/m.11935 type:complete len:198 (-) Transcript_5097:174-767(-)|eukprot:CAMPEP_0172619504 /NCGR_PEP_ID=MMETSP1068-20121228/93873_1 /TAXON_ID=35684 /ORGANISM="Pseudopedinella elastica, Strain CCMP716" /LENGTH=197 /DNA_ID=CAMNT_0013426281 /DNA_START=94 /DNA_END=687 /DNA_ORIENTATION=+